MHDEVVVALREQLDELRSMVEPLDEDGFASPSACEGWSVSDVLLHLAQTNEMAIASLRGTFGEAIEPWPDAAPGATVDDLAGLAVERERGARGRAVYERWQQTADDFAAAADDTPADARVPWIVGDMAARTLVTTRFTETWIHTGDVADGLGIERKPTEHIRHIVRLVHRTIPYAFVRAGNDAPGSVRFEVTSPTDPTDVWTFGDDDAATVITGPALDLVRVAGQRADASDTELRGTGPDAADVLALMRTFA